MAIAFDAAAHGTYAAGATSLSWSHVVGSGTNRLLVVGIADDNNGSNPVSSVTYNGTALTFIAGTNAAQPGWTQMWYLLNPPTGTANVVVTTSLATGINGISASYTGVSQSGQPDASTTALAGSGSTFPVSLTTVATNSWAILFALNNQGGTTTAGSGTTLRANSLTSLCCMLGDTNGPKTPAGSVTLNGQGPSGFWGGAMASFSPAPIGQAISAVATGVAGFSLAHFYARSLSAVATAVVSVAKLRTAIRAISATATAVASLTTSTILKWIIEQKSSLVSFVLEGKQDNTE